MTDKDLDVDTTNFGSSGPGLITIAFGIAFGWGLIEFYKTGSAAAIFFFIKWWVITVLALLGFVIGFVIIGLILYALYSVAT